MSLCSRWGNWGSKKTVNLSIVTESIDSGSKTKIQRSLSVSPSWSCCVSWMIWLWRRGVSWDLPVICDEDLSPEAISLSPAVPEPGQRTHLHSSGRCRVWGLGVGEEDSWAGEEDDDNNAGQQDLLWTIDCWSWSCVSYAPHSWQWGLLAS